MEKITTVQNHDTVGTCLDQTATSYIVLDKGSLQELEVATQGNTFNPGFTICTAFTLTDTKAVHMKTRSYFSQTEAIPSCCSIKQAVYFISGVKGRQNLQPFVYNNIFQFSDSVPCKNMVLILLLINAASTYSSLSNTLHIVKYKRQFKINVSQSYSNSAPSGFKINHIC